MQPRHVSLRRCLSVVMVSLLLLPNPSAARAQPLAEAIPASTSADPVDLPRPSPPAPGGQASVRGTPTPAAAQATLNASSPLFIENVGQFAPSGAMVGPRFQMWGGAGTTWLAEDAIWITLVEPPTPTLRLDESARPGRPEGPAAEPRDPPRRAVRLRLSFVGTNPHPRLEPYGRAETKVSYLIGADPKAWHPDVPVWRGVRYGDLYPGVDLVIGADEGAPHSPLPWRLKVRDGMGAHSSAPLQEVRLRVEGAEALSLAGGAVLVQTVLGALRLPLLAVAGALTEAPTLAGTEARAPFAPAGSAGIVVAANNPSDLRYATFLGDGEWDEGSGIAVDGAGCAHVTGVTVSPDFPVAAGPGYDTTYGGGRDAFALKLNAAGTGLLYATFLGGGDRDEGRGIALDGTGCAYLTGSTQSAAFTAASGSGYDTSHNGGSDAFALKLNAAGTGLLYATFLGSGHGDAGSGIAVDGAGCAYVTGNTSSPSFPAAAGPGYDTSYNGGYIDAFALKLNAVGTGLVYATFLGGSHDDWGSRITVDGAGCAYVTGGTCSPDFPAAVGPGYDMSHNGSGDAFVLKLNAAGTGLFFATFLGGGDQDWGYGIAVDGAGCAYITGDTYSADFPAAAGPGYDTNYNGGGDAFALRLNAAGTGLLYATFLGGGEGDGGTGIPIDAAGCAYVTGLTYSADFPAAAGPGYDTSHNGDFDAFALKLNAAGTGLLYATFLGGGYWDDSIGIAVDRAACAYVTGQTWSANFPAAAGPGYDTSYNGGRADAFALKLAMGPAQALSVTKTDGQSTFCAGWDLRYAILITNTASTPLHGVVCTDTLPPELYAIAPLPAGATTHPDGSVTWQVGTLAGNEVRQVELWVRSYVTARGMLTNTVLVGCAECALRAEASDETVFVAAPVGSPMPSSTATPTVTGTPTPTPTETPTLPLPTWTPNPTGTDTPVLTATPSSTGPPTLPPTAIAAPTETPTRMPLPTDTPAPTVTLTATPTPTAPRGGVYLPVVWGL